MPLPPLPAHGTIDLRVRLAHAAQSLRQKGRRAGWRVAAMSALVLIAVAGLLLPPRSRRPALSLLLGLSSPVHAQSGPTIVHVDGGVLHEQVKRLGINMGGQDFYDSRQMLRNLVSRNPGFEGEQWQSILQCRFVTPVSCTDVAAGTSWPNGFLDGGTYEVIAGAAEGRSGKILHSSAATWVAGTTIFFAPSGKLPAIGDTVVVRKAIPGDAAAGWWTSVAGGAAVTTEFKDLSPSTPGRQALRIAASSAGQSAAVSSFFDSTRGHTFVRLRGPYMVRFRAKGLGGNRNLTIQVKRLAGAPPLLERTLPLSATWQDYTLPFYADESPETLGTAALTFSVAGASVLLDDVSLAPANSNGTAFRDEVVAALESLQPGVLRDMDSGQGFGSSLDNLLGVPEARVRPGYSKYSARSEEIPIGLHDFLVLAEKVGAEPWFTMPLGMTEAEARDLFEYLGGPTDTHYGARRAALGHPAPWTHTFPLIHIEYGNEAWNYDQQGASIADPAAYAARATTIFRAMRSSPWFAVPHYDLVANGQAVNLYLNRKILETASGFDTLDIAPYLFSTFSDDATSERIFGPMLAEPEMYDSRPGGIVHQQAQLAAGARHPVHLAVYETGMNALNGTASQKTIDAAVPSLGAALAAIEHMLLMQRDLGILVQNTFHLGGFETPFANADGPGEQSPLWGVVLDMGGATGRARPVFLAQKMANQAIRTTMLTTSISGDDPTWNQPLSANDHVQLQGAHELQSFAYTDGQVDTLIVFNLSRTASHTLRLAGASAPQGVVRVETLASSKITDGNETEDTVAATRRTESNVLQGQTAFALPPFSMTVFASEHHSDER